MPRIEPWAPYTQLPRPPTMASCACTSGVLLDERATSASVRTYYGETLKRSSDLRTSACCAAAPPAHVRHILSHPSFPAEVLSTFYGCGSPVPVGIDGLRVCDLGCGSGRDCYVASSLVGPGGSVVGVDFTPKLLDVAQRHKGGWAAELGYDNMTFLHGHIEDLKAAGVSPGSMDLARAPCDTQNKQ